MMDVSMSVIPLGLEPKTYCLEGSCSIQLSYGTDLNYRLPFKKSAAKVVIFFEPTKLFPEIFAKFIPNYFFAGFQLP